MTDLDAIAEQLRSALFDFLEVADLLVLRLTRRAYRAHIRAAHAIAHSARRQRERAWLAQDKPNTRLRGSLSGNEIHDLRNLRIRDTMVAERTPFSYWFAVRPSCIPERREIWLCEIYGYLPEERPRSAEL